MEVMLFEKKKITITDIKKICIEIAKHDPRAYGMLSTHKLKKRYTGLLNKLTGEVETAIKQESYRDVSVKLHEYAKMIHRYSMLKPNLQIEKVLIDDVEYIKVSETDKRMKQDYLRIVFEYSRQNKNNSFRGKDVNKRTRFDMRVKETEKINDGVPIHRIDDSTGLGRD